MAMINVNPTRMELTKIKKRLKVARRGHKLLKDKRDALIKIFLEVARQNKDLREDIEERLVKMYKDFLIARSVMSNQSFETALAIPNQEVAVGLMHKNIMSVNVPEYVFDKESFDNPNIYPYGFVNSSGELDSAIGVLSEIFPKLILLGQVEKTVHLLAEEIEKTRRRVNALEYVLIPELTETIKRIKMKLDEVERGNLTRLMKVKEMMVKKVIESHQQEKK